MLSCDFLCGMGFSQWITTSTWYGAVTPAKPRWVHVIRDILLRAVFVAQVSQALSSPAERPYDHKVDQPIASVIVPLDASGRPSHPGAVASLDRRQPPSGKSADAVEPCPLVRPDRDNSPIASLIRQTAVGQDSIPCSGAAGVIAMDPDQVARGWEYDFQNINGLSLAVGQCQTRRGGGRQNGSARQKHRFLLWMAGDFLLKPFIGTGVVNFPPFVSQA
jgi:hypothetical protein